MFRITRRVVAGLGAGALALGSGACAAEEEPDSGPGTVTSVVTSTASGEPTTPTPTATTSSTRAPVTTTTATQTPTTQIPTTSPRPEDRCDPAVLQQGDGDFVDTVLYCDGTWARGGLAQSDYVGIFTWADGRWNRHTPDGESPETGYDCYDEDRLIASGAPQPILDTALLCTG